MCIYAWGIRSMAHMWRAVFSSSTMWDLGMELRFLELEASQPEFYFLDQFCHGLTKTHFSFVVFFICSVFFREWDILHMCVGAYARGVGKMGTRVEARS